MIMYPRIFCFMIRNVRPMKQKTLCVDHGVAPAKHGLVGSEGTAAKRNDIAKATRRRRRILWSRLPFYCRKQIIGLNFRKGIDDSDNVL